MISVRVTPMHHLTLVVRARCWSRLAGYKCPKSVDIVAALPRNASGKVLKHELRKPYWEGRETKI
jgi:acyl-CoA synthetase (AMP-forming)/AMP-acid ligase II